MSNKVLILVPDQNIENRLGGIHNFYMNLKDHLLDNHFYYYINNDNIKYKNKAYASFVHFRRVYKKLKKDNFDCLVLNTSLNINAILRDSFYILIAKVLKIKTVVFWRGWSFANQKYLKLPYSLYTSLLLKPSVAIVLYSKIETSLRSLGFKNKVYHLSTLVKNETFKYKATPEVVQETFNLLFLSRIESYKGVFELVDAFSVLSKKYPNIKLNIVGDGNALDEVMGKVKEKNITNVEFLGYLKGQDKYQIMLKSNCFVFPSYSEGMPNAVLEAMAIGLPIITTPVGGLNDFFEDNVMGKFVKIKDIDSLVDAMEEVYLNQQLRSKSSVYNAKFAKENFRIDKVYQKLSSIVNHV
jgi:glycosyltransferase involved in cell wall biosynthesis